MCREPSDNRGMMRAIYGVASDNMGVASDNRGGRHAACAVSQAILWLSVECLRDSER